MAPTSRNRCAYAAKRRTGMVPALPAQIKVATGQFAGQMLLQWIDDVQKRETAKVSVGATGSGSVRSFLCPSGETGRVPEESVKPGCMTVLAVLCNKGLLINPRDAFIALGVPAERGLRRIVEAREPPPPRSSGNSAHPRSRERVPASLGAPHRTRPSGPVRRRRQTIPPRCRRAVLFSAGTQQSVKSVSRMRPARDARATTVIYPSNPVCRTFVCSGTGRGL